MTASKGIYRKRNMGLAESVQWAYSQTELGGPNGDCWIWQRPTNKKGYPLIRFKGKKVLVSRLIMILHEGEYPNLYVCHSCDNPICINPDHLRWDTPSSNQIDRALRGKRNQRLILTAVKVRYIRILSKFGFSQREIASYYGVARTTISSIVNNYNWQHIT